MNTLVILLALGASYAVSSDVCDLGFDPGPCKGNNLTINNKIILIIKNKIQGIKNVVAFEDGKCVPKVYGGCRGNGNRLY